MSLDKSVTYVIELYHKASNIRLHLERLELFDEFDIFGIFKGFEI